MIVLDASVAVKWFLLEADSESAERVLSEQFGKIIVPDLFLIEVNAALVRNANIDKPRAALCKLHIVTFAEIIADDGISPIRLTPDLMANATDVAIAIGHPLKDCIYLALAMELTCPLVTADTRFAAKAQGAYDGVQVLGRG